jgi:hypothetical protein
MITINDWIATTPFPSVNVKTVHHRGVALAEQQTKLTELTVLYTAALKDGRSLNPGDKVYVKGDAMKHQWSGDILTTEDDTKYILVPIAIVVAIKEKV